MADLVKVGDLWVHRREIAAVLPQDGRTIIFLRGGKSISIPEFLSNDEIMSLLFSIYPDE